MTLNLHSHSTSDLSRNHKVIDELTSLVEVTERAAFTSSAAVRKDVPLALKGREASVTEVSEQRPMDSHSLPAGIKPCPQIQFTPRVLSPEELILAEEAHRFDQLSDFDPMYGNDDFEEEE